MKHFTLFKALSITCLFWILGIQSNQAYAQLSGTKTVGIDYPTVAAFVNDVNLQGVMIGGGGVTLQIPSGYTETAPIGGYIITATGSLADPIIINGDTGPNPVITANAALVSGSLNDAIFKIVGGDYITISNLNLTENAANTTTAAATNNMTEWGIALLYNTTSDGAQYCSLLNNVITLNRTYQNTFGIYANATHSATAPTTSATAVAGGGNNGLIVYGNAISNVNNGILVVGPAGATDLNDGIDIGGTSASTGNTITNFGTTGTFSSYANVSGSVNGILVRNSKNINVSRNTITSSVGGTTAGTLRGIYVPSFSNAPTGTYTNTFSNNNISIQSGSASGAINGINIEATTSNTNSTITMASNNFSTFGHTVAGTGAITFISSAVPILALNINNNTFTNMSVNTSGSVTFIAHPYSMISGTSQTFSGNSIVTGFAKTTAGGSVIFTTSNSVSTSGSTSSYLNNVVSNITLTGATSFTGFNNTDGGSGSTKIVTGNTFQNITGGSSAITAINITYWSGVSLVTNNTINGLNGQGAITGMNIGSSANNATSIDINGNTITSLLSTGTGGSVIGIGCSNTSALIRIYANKLNTFATTGSSTISGIVISGATNTSAFGNKIYDLSASNASGTVNGMLISGGTSVSAYNNTISDLRTPNANAANPLNGINVTGGTAVALYYNSVYLSGTSVGALFGSSAVSASSTPNLTLANNLFINETTPTGAGIAAAYRRSSTTLTSYNNASNRNMFFAGTPSASNLIMYDGTNSYQTLTAYQTAVSTRDLNSITGEVGFTYGTPGSYFVSLTGSSVDFLRPVAGITTQTESGGVNITSPSITTDYSSVIRAGNVGYVGTGTAPDMGAYEFEGISPTPIITFNSSSPAATAQCTASTRTISADLTTTSGTIVSGSIVYAFNGTPQGSIPMTNSGGNTWTGVIPVATPLNATVTWGIVASNSLGLNGSYTGTPYADEPLTGVSASVSATNTTVCEGSPSELTATLSNTGTVTVGTSGLTTTSTEELTAFCNRRITYRQQTVYTAAELTALGLSAGPITSMGYTIATTGDAANTSNFTVLIGNTALSALTGYVSSAGFTTVHPAATYNHAVGLNTITFSTPFNWDGTSNIIVEVSHGGINSINNAQTFYTTTASNTVAFGFNGTATATLSNKRFNTNFTGNNAPAITSVTWNPGAISGNPATVNPVSTTTYTATIIASGCAVSPSPTIQVNVDPLPTAPTATNSAQCGTQIPTASVASTSGLSTPTFIWYDMPTAGTAMQTDLSTTYNSNVATTTTFYVAELNSLTGCESPRIPVTITVATADGVSATPSVASICIGSSFTLDAANTNPSPLQNYTYSWDGVANSGVGTGVPGASISVTPTQPGTYQYDLTAVDGGCSAVASATVIVNPFVATVAPVDITCNGYNNGSFTLTGSSCGTMPYTYSVDNGAYGPIPTDLTPGAHTVQVSDDNGYLSAVLNITITEPSTVIPAPVTTSTTVCITNPVANVSATATIAPIPQTLTLPLTIASQPVEVQTAPGVVVTTVTVPVLPVGSVVTGVTINVNGLVPHGGEYQSDVRLGLSGIFTNAAAQGTGAIGFGTVAETPFDYTRTISGAGFPLSGGALDLLYWDNYNDVVGADDCSFPIGSGVGSIVINYTIPAPTTISWWNASTMGTQEGTGSPFNAVGTTVLPNTNTPGVYTLYAQGEYLGCSGLTRTPVTVTVNPTSTSNTLVTNCASFTWTNGTTYTTSGVYTQTLTNSLGCDSIATLDLTILNASASTTTVSECASYTWTNGTTYTASGTYTQTLTNAVGCDSIATLDLTVLSPSASTTTVSICDLYLWTDGVTYTNSGTYTQTLTNALGCDSVATLDLTINAATSGSETVAACGSYLWEGTSYTTSGTYTAMLVNSAGCDSIATLDLTINTATSGSETVSACDMYSWAADNMTYTTSGTYTATLTNAAGCDSTATLILTINPTPSASVTDNGNNTLTSSASTGNQWINCATNLPVAGATSQTFAPTANGSYAVVVTGAGGCASTSSCVTISTIGIDEIAQDYVKVYPNPTLDVVTIDFPYNSAVVKVIDAQGKMISESVIVSGQDVSLMNCERGLYYFTVTTESGSSIHKVVKQ